MRSLLGRFHRPNARSQTEQLFMLNSLGDGSTLSLDFTTGVLDPRFTFTRSTTGTYINSSGYVTSAAINTPRFDYDPTTLTPRGLLIEGSANSFTRSSQDLTNATYWTLQTAYASTSTAGGTAPDGTNSGNLFTEPSSSLQRSIYQSYSSAAGTYTFSVWLKEGSGSTRYMRLVVSSSASDFGYVTINMSTGAVQQSAAISGTATNASATVSGNYSATGWRRYSLTVTLAASVNFVFLIPTDLASIDTPTSNYGRIQYLGDGSSFLVWGAQLETGSGASSYIPTGASQGSRAVDTAIIAAGTAFSGWYTGGLNGTFYADWYGGVAGASGTQRSVLATDDVTTKHLHLYQTATTNTMTLANFGGGSTLATSNAISPAGSRSKAAFSYATSAMNVCLNGGTVASGTVTGFTVAPTWLSLGAPSTNGTSITGTTVVLNNSIRSIKYWPTVLSNAQLQDLTT